LWVSGGHGNCKFKVSHIQEAFMPVPLPAKAATITRAERWTIDWIGVWALIIGAMAISLSAFIYFADHDPVAASFVFIAFAAIIGVVLRESVPRHESR
jgi:hypothetical protein